MAPNTTEDHALEVPVGGHKLAMPMRYLHLGLPDLPEKMEKEEGAIVGGERTVVLEAETDPVTLRPTRASSETKIRLVSASGKQYNRRDTKESVFDWAGAQGCGSR